MRLIPSSWRLCLSAIPYDIYFVQTHLLPKESPLLQFHCKSKSLNSNIAHSPLFSSLNTEMLAIRVPFDATPESLQTTEPFPETQESMNESSTRDELFFSVEPSHGPIPSYLLFEPVVSSVAYNRPIDWRRYDPPGELLRVQGETSRELKHIVTTSIKRLQARRVEEIQGRAATARPERPLTRGRRVSVKPQAKVSCLMIYYILHPADKS